MIRFFMIFLFAALVIAALLLPCGAIFAMDEPIPTVWPAANAHRSSAQSVAEDTEEPHVVRVGAVMFAADVFLPQSPMVGKRTVASTSFQDAGLSVAFFPDREYRVRIDSETLPGPEALSLGGRIPEHELSTFTMTVTGESYLITLQDMDTAMLYRVVGETETGLGTVTEIDLRKTPPIEYLPPVVPTPEP